MAIELCNFFYYRDKEARCVLVVGHYPKTSCQLLLDFLAVEVREHSDLDVRVVIGRDLIIVLILFEKASIAC